MCPANVNDYPRVACHSKATASHWFNELRFMLPENKYMGRVCDSELEA